MKLKTIDLSLIWQICFKLIINLNNLAVNRKLGVSLSNQVN